MYKSILAPATGSPGDEAVFQAALLAARPFASHIAFLHVKMDVTAIVVAMSTGDGLGGGGAAIQGMVDQLEADAARQEEKARAAVNKFCASAGLPTGTSGSGATPTADLAVETGDEGQWLAEYGRFADLIVVGRARDREAATDVLESALMNTGKPVLIAAETAPATLLDTVVIAWKDTVEAARAVAAAMPLIERAGRVVILSVGEGTDDAASTQRLQQALRRHVAATTAQVIPSDDRPAVEVLLEAARGLGATLLVMGGYSHSRLREVVFGGFTRHVLRAADIPVLMVH